MTSIGIIVLLILDSESLIEKLPFVLHHDLVEFDLFWYEKTARQTHSNKILWSSSWYFSTSLGRNYAFLARSSKFEIFFIHDMRSKSSNPDTLRWRSIRSSIIYRHHSKITASRFLIHDDYVIDSSFLKIQRTIKSDII